MVRGADTHLGETFIPPLESAGYKRILARWRRPFQTKDGYLAVVPYTDTHWRTFFEIAVDTPSPERLARW